ncbi:hypothetical protein ACFY7C_27555 [Streptomyces sp. NPDC012769]|uniref:hypothetical protein n=1 Tax=Streptomyces sp. NPDC012769 TaxID=3364848 RepID=UPI0036A0C3CD
MRSGAQDPPLGEDFGGAGGPGDAAEPQLEVTATAAALAGLRQTRLVTSVTGGHNLAIGAWLRSVGELHEITTGMERAAPSIRITGTSLSLRIHKAGARVLGPDGRRMHHVRPDIRRPLRVPDRFR